MICNKCGNKIPDDSKFCSFCGNHLPTIMNQEQARHRTKIFSNRNIGIFLIIIILLGAFLGKQSRTMIDSKLSSTNNTANLKSPSRTYSKNTPPPPSVKNDWTVYYPAVGRVKGKLSSNVGIAVVGIKNASYIGDKYYGAKARGKFVIVDVLVSNGQKDAVTVDSNSFTLIDSSGKRYSSSFDGNMALEMKSDDNVNLLTEINPGIEVKASMAFDIPQNVNDLKLEARGGITGSPIILPLQVQRVD